MTSIRKLCVALLMAIALVPLAVAQEDKSVSEQIGMFTPSESDTSVQFLREAFGNVISLIHPGSETAGQRPEDPLAAGMQIFNGAALFLGMLFVIYTTIRGTIDSAHDGELLGRKMHSMWVPLRTLGGSAAIAPLPSGYSLVQIAVLWIAVQGAGVADHIWRAMMDQLAKDGMIATPVVPEARQLAAHVLKAETCMAAMNAHWEEAGDTRRVAVRETTTTLTNRGEVLGLTETLASPAVGVVRLAQSISAAKYEMTEFRWDGGNYLSGEPACGALEWRESGESAEGNSNTGIDKAPILAAHAVAVRQMIETLRPTAEAIVAGQKPVPGAIDDAARMYEQTIRQGAKTAVHASNERAKTEFIELAKEGGWIYAGTYYNQIVRLNDAMQSAINALPAPSPITITSKETSIALIKYGDSLAVADEYIKNRSAAPQPRLRTALAGRGTAACVLLGGSHTAGVVAGARRSQRVDARHCGLQPLSHRPDEAPRRHDREYRLGDRRCARSRSRRR